LNRTHRTLRSSLIDCNKIDKQLRRHVGPTYYCKTILFKGYRIGQIWERFPLGDRKIIDILDPAKEPCNFNDHHMLEVIEHKRKLRSSIIGRKHHSGGDYATNLQWIKDIKGRKAASADD